MYNTTNEWLYDVLIIVPFFVFLFGLARLSLKKLRGEPAPPPDPTAGKIVLAVFLTLPVVIAAVIVDRGVYDLPYPLAWLGGLYAAVLLCLAVAIVLGTDVVRRVAMYSALLFVFALVMYYIGGRLSDPLFPVVGYTVFCAALAIYALFRKLSGSPQTH